MLLLRHQDARALLSHILHHPPLHTYARARFLSIVRAST
jgi:hypothetical protein